METPHLTPRPGGGPHQLQVWRQSRAPGGPRSGFSVPGNGRSMEGTMMINHDQPAGELDSFGKLIPWGTLWQFANWKPWTILDGDWNPKFSGSSPGPGDQVLPPSHAFGALVS